jgi:hypothetical protein
LGITCSILPFCNGFFPISSDNFSSDVSMIINC